MNNSYNYSTFTSLISSDIQKESDIRAGDSVSPDDALTSEQTGSDKPFSESRSELD